MERVLPTHAFHVVFTLPSELHGLVMGDRERLSFLPFASAAEALLELGRDPRWLGAELGSPACFTPGLATCAFTPTCTAS